MKKNTILDPPLEVNISLYRVAPVKNFPPCRTPAVRDPTPPLPLSLLTGRVQGWVSGGWTRASNSQRRCESGKVNPVIFLLSLAPVNSTSVPHPSPPGPGLVLFSADEMLQIVWAWPCFCSVPEPYLDPASHSNISRYHLCPSLLALAQNKKKGEGRHLCSW